MSNSRDLYNQTNLLEDGTELQEALDAFRWWPPDEEDEEEWFGLKIIFQVS